MTLVSCKGGDVARLGGKSTKSLVAGNDCERRVNVAKEEGCVRTCTGGVLSGYVTGGETVCNCGICNVLGAVAVSKDTACGVEREVILCTVGGYVTGVKA